MNFHLSISLPSFPLHFPHRYLREIVFAHSHIALNCTLISKSYGKLPDFWADKGVMFFSIIFYYLCVNEKTTWMCQWMQCWTCNCLTMNCQSRSTSSDPIQHHPQSIRSLSLELLSHCLFLSQIFLHSCPLILLFMTYLPHTSAWNTAKSPCFDFEIWLILLPPLLDIWFLSKSTKNNRCIGFGQVV